MKILITGGMGFVGSHLCDELLKENHKLVIITKSNTKKNNVLHILKKAKIEKVDITNFSKLGKCIEKHKPQVIIHLAGETSHSKSFEEPLYNIDSNAKSTLFILEKIRKMNLKCKFILGSTFIVVGKPNRLPVNEQTPCNPTTIYGTNRLASFLFAYTAKWRRDYYEKIHSLEMDYYGIRHNLTDYRWLCFIFI